MCEIDVKPEYTGELIDELKARGYEGTLQKKVIETVKL